MTTTIPLFEFMPYGAPELLGVARKHMVRATLVSSALAAAAFALLGSATRIVTQPPAPPSISVTLPEIRLQPPPALENVAPPPLVEATPSPHERPGVPLPVPEPQAPLDQTIQDQKGLSSSFSTPQSQPGPIVVPPSREDEVLPKPNDPVYVEELPEPVVRVDPNYPDIARDLGIGGLVRVRVLVGKDGRVLDALVDDKANVPILNNSALEAAGAGCSSRGSPTATP